MSHKFTKIEKATGAAIALGIRHTVAAVMTGTWRAIKYVSPKWVVRATRSHRHFDRRDASVVMSLSIGRPNYLERAFIKDLVKAGEPFPVKKTIFRDAPVPPKKKNAKKK